MSDNPEFIDSNILIYAHDRSAGEKRGIALDLLGRLWRERAGCLSVQVLQEFCVNVTRKIPKPLGFEEAGNIVTSLGSWRVHSPSLADVTAALLRQKRFDISFWDSMILESASQLGCALVWSEDLNSGQLYGDVEVRNPFTHSARK